MSWMFYYQQNGGEDAWQPAMAEMRAKIIAEKQPRFVTVLDLDTVMTDTMTRDEIAAVKYAGPAYFDFDAADIQTVLPKFQQFLGKLQEQGVNLAACRIYASGVKGFHIEVPQAIFMPKIPKNGLLFLPAIYKELAYSLLVDTLDLRVYSARKGRMWRTPGVKRENGTYKVPLDAEEALTLTVEEYAQAVASPRAAPPLAAPTLAEKLCVEFVKAEQKVVAAAKKRKDTSKDLELLARFKGDYPPSLLKIMTGELASEQGFHKIAMQVAVTSNAIGKKEDEVLAVCEGLVQNHVSDGNRYNTPVKRRAEISRMLAYTADNVCYTYNRAAVRSLLPASQPSPDLDGLPASAGAVTSGDNGNDDGLLQGVFMAEGGIYRRSAEGAVKLSDLAFKDVTLLADAVTGKPLGFESEILVQGKSRGRQLVSLETFLTKSHFSRFAMQHMGVMMGTDNHVAALATILRDTAMTSGSVVYVVSREGLDLIQRPDAPASTMDFVWVTPRYVTTADGNPTIYKHRGSPTIEGLYKSDLLSAPLLTATAETEKTIEAVLNVNRPEVVGNILGWMVGAFHKQIYHHIYGQFPLLMLYGQSGAGKTSTQEDFLSLHYHLSKPLICQADSSTPFAIEGAMQSSASIPCVLEEYKPREMRPGRHGRLKSMLRSAYNSQTYQKGGMAQEPGTTWRDLRTFAFAAPVVFIGEALEAETAIVDRTVTVPLDKGGLVGRQKYHWWLRDNRQVLASIGHQIVRATFGLDFAKFREQVDMNVVEASKAFDRRNSDRPVFNLAVILTSLDFVTQVLAQTFGDKFAERLAVLRRAVLEKPNYTQIVVLAEASKVLNALAYISRAAEPMSEDGLQMGVDYLSTDGYLDLNMRNCWVKYSSWCKRRGQVLYYDNEDGFTHGLGHYTPTRSKAPLDSKLKIHGTEKVFRFDLKALEEEGVEPFRG